MMPPSVSSHFVSVRAREEVLLSCCLSSGTVHCSTSFSPCMDSSNTWMHQQRLPRQQRVPCQLTMALKGQQEEKNMQVTRKCESAKP